ncbi:YceI family protein [Leptospira sp. WS92.C1]
MLLFVLFVLTLSVYDLFAEKSSKLLELRETNIRFISEAPQESISGVFTKAEGNANLETKKVSIRVNLQDLSVPNRLMNRHMHENYLESDRYPIAIFEGNISKWDRSNKTVIIEGDFTLHGITKKNFRIQGNFEEKENGFLIKSNFEIFLTDFKIEIPKLVVLKLNDKIQIATSIVWQNKE